MFETSVVRVQAMESRGKVSLLTISVVAHSAIVIGAIAMSIASVSFPKMAPDEFAQAPIFAVIQIPPPLGNPNAGTQAQKPPEQKKQAALPPNTITAPPTVPDKVTPTDTPSTGNDIAEGPSTGDGTVPGPIGVPWGTKDSTGDLDAPPLTTTMPAVENKVYTVGEVKAPVIITRVDPIYPHVLMRAKLPGKVMVHCIIDKNGRIRDAKVVYATNPAFGNAVLQALPGWRYTPASLQGTAVDCYLDLTVDFGVR